MRQDVGEEGVADDRVAEGVTGVVRLDDPGGERSGRGGRTPRARRVPTSRRTRRCRSAIADDRHALEHLARRGSDAADHVDVDVAHPLRFVCGAPARARRRRRALPPLSAAIRSTTSSLGSEAEASCDDRADGVVVERREVDLVRAVPSQQARSHLGERRGRRRPMAHARTRRARRPSNAREVVQEPQAGLVGLVQVVDRQQQPGRRGREAA